MPRRNDIQKILLIGAGPIVIGQACEFDYSGTQACKVLRDEGYYVILVNSNPATIMTDPATADRTYIEAMRSGNIDLAWLPPFSYVQAEKMAHAKVLLKIVRHGRSDMFSAIITRTDRHLNTLHDLKGKSIAWVDPASASGHIIPKAAVIEKEKVDPDIFFGKQVFAGGHDAVVLAVYNGTVDAGATWLNDKFGKDGAWNLYLKKDSDKIHVSFISEAIPTDTLATTELFSTKNPALLAKTVSLLQSMSKDEAGGKVLRDLYGIDALIPAKNSDYDIIRRAAVATGISKK